MKTKTKFNVAIAALFLIGLGFASCKKNKDVVLPDINGYASSDAVAIANLKAYWALDGNGNESKSGTAPTSSVGVTYTTGIKGQAASFANGYIYYASAVGGALASNQPFSVSAWVQATNNFMAGGNAPANNHPYQYFTLARPGQFWGNVNLTYEAGQYGAGSDTMVFKSLYSDAGGVQDNINNYTGTAGIDYKVSKKAGTGQWVHMVTTYNPAGGTGAQSIFRIYADSAMISNINFENKSAISFVYSPHEVIIGGWYNNIPGKTVSADLWTTPFTGKIDEIRVYNKLLTTDEITALYHLGKAGR